MIIGRSDYPSGVFSQPPCKKSCLEKDWNGASWLIMVPVRTMPHLTLNNVEISVLGQSVRKGDPDKGFQELLIRLDSLLDKRSGHIFLTNEVQEQLQEYARTLGDRLGRVAAPEGEQKADTGLTVQWSRPKSTSKPREPISSSSIDGMDYRNGTLEVRFQDGSVYQYFDVPEPVHRELSSAVSIPDAFNALIRHQYRCAQIKA
jgi:hypothetical protein